MTIGGAPFGTTLAAGLGLAGFATLFRAILESPPFARAAACLRLSAAVATRLAHRVSNSAFPLITADAPISPLTLVAAGLRLDAAIATVLDGWGSRRTDPLVIAAAPVFPRALIAAYSVLCPALTATLGLVLANGTLTLVDALLPQIVASTVLYPAIATGLGVACRARSLSGAFPPQAGVHTNLVASVTTGLLFTHRTDPFVHAGFPRVAAADLDAAFATRRHLTVVAEKRITYKAITQKTLIARARVHAFEGWRAGGVCVAGMGALFTRIHRRTARFRLTSFAAGARQGDPRRCVLQGVTHHAQVTVDA